MGSGTTGHAVLKCNAEDKGCRKFILVEHEDYADILTAERVKSVINGYKFVGVHKTTLLQEKITITQLKKANTLLKKVEVIIAEQAKNFDKIKKEIKGGTLIVRGEKKISDKKEGLGGGFQFCRLSEQPLFTATGQIREDVSFAQLAEFVWFQETGVGFTGQTDSPLIGIFEGRAIYLLYNGILKDKTTEGGNILTPTIFKLLPAFNGHKVIYATAKKGGASWLKREKISFKQTPYALDV